LSFASTNTPLPSRKIEYRIPLTHGYANIHQRRTDRASEALDSRQFRRRIDSNHRFGAIRSIRRSVDPKVALPTG